MKKHFDLYKKYMKTGRMDNDGLCSLAAHDLISQSIFALIKPSPLELEELEANDYSVAYWGSGKSFYNLNRSYAFTPLRQTILLLMAAINDEL